MTIVIRIERIPALALAAAMLAQSGIGHAADRAGDPAKGKTVFARCAICHTVEAGTNKVGPSLANIVGQKAGTAPGFNFSSAMKASKIIWTPETLDRYLTNPRAVVPGNKMIFAGLPNAAERANLVAYLIKPVK